MYFVRVFKILMSACQLEMIGAPINKHEIVEIAIFHSERRTFEPWCYFRGNIKTNVRELTPLNICFPPGAF